MSIGKKRPYIILGIRKALRALNIESKFFGNGLVVSAGVSKGLMIYQDVDNPYYINVSSVADKNKLGIRLQILAENAPHAIAKMNYHKLLNIESYGSGSI